MTRTAIVVATLMISRIAVADLANNEALHAHVDDVVRRSDKAHRPPPADRWKLSLGVLIPIFGSYELDTQMFGGIRPAAVIFDWILGGAAPVGLGVAALASSGTTRSILGWTAIGLYASTRIGVLIIGNLHITEYDRYLNVRLGVVESAAGAIAPAITASSSF